MFPTEWKCARISVIPKIDNPTTGDDYHPISILPVLSTVFERLIKKQLRNFIETNNIYSQLTLAIDVITQQIQSLSK